MAEASSADTRLVPLDGLRGLAASTVVVHHLVMASSVALAGNYAGGPARLGSLLWWATDTPLHIFWAGPEAVVIFFVLSGFVLALPAVALGRRWFRPSYYPRRLIRLYLPVWGAIAIALGWRLVESRRKIPDSSWWLQAHSGPQASIRTVLVQATLRDTGTWAIDPVLWSLHWEVLFSVILPLVLLLLVAIKKHPGAATLICLACLAGVAWGSVNGEAHLQYLPIFVVGAVLAFHIDRVRGVIASAPGPVLWLVSITTLLLLTAPYWTEPAWGHGFVARSSVGAASNVSVVIGAAAVIVMATGRPSLSAFLESKPLKWVGSRSYSLYLVHEPVIVTLAYLLKARYTVVLIAASIPIAVALTEVFWQLVERHSIRLSRRLGSAVSRNGARIRLSAGSDGNA